MCWCWGPGLGQNGWGQQVWQKAMQTECTKVIDADALNLMASHSEWLDKLPDSCRNWVLTPHPGEAARLLNCSVSEIEQDRPAAVRRLSDRYGGTVLLKGAGTLLLSEGRLAVNNSGNPGMASGGMGDVLSGLVGAFACSGADRGMMPPVWPCRSTVRRRINWPVVTASEAY